MKVVSDMEIATSFQVVGLRIQSTDTVEKLGTISRCV